MYMNITIFPKVWTLMIKQIYMIEIISYIIWFSRVLEYN